MLKTAIFIFCFTMILIGCNATNGTSAKHSPSPTVQNELQPKSTSTNNLTGTGKDIDLIEQRQVDSPDHISFPNHSNVISQEEITISAGKATLLKLSHDNFTAATEQEKGLGKTDIIYWLYITQPFLNDSTKVNTYILSGVVTGNDKAAKSEILEAAQKWNPFTSTQSIKVIRKINVDQDGKIDEVQLYYNGDNGDVGLQVKNSQVTILKVDSEKQIFATQPSDHYTFQLYIDGNKILVGITYAFTNKYGSTSDVYCYEYKNSQLSKIWSTDDYLQKRLMVKSYNEQSNTMDVILDQDSKKIILDNEEAKAYLAYAKTQKESGQTELELILTITPAFTFFDYNRDGVKELITKTIVNFGACPITKTYYSAYHFSKDGIRQLDSWFNGSNPALEQNIPFN